MHVAVNACLYPLCAVHGKAVTTVEGVGSPNTGLHEIQVRTCKLGIHTYIEEYT
ncbi:hypothetical protein DPMN_114628 [Dreissena polymorpha]|uniref:Uncharacterized protein n=1 Tax=Dreissena polymorpha TaxID=45954 RepID=A0A9D4QT12_DREPO|nr:hypothetical protein DPMN_114628 [Dreissena polymorpha]